MGGLIAPREVPYLIVYLIGVMVIASTATIGVGRLSKWRFPRLTVFVAGLLIPALLVGFAAYVLVFYPDSPPPNDAKAMASMGLIFAAIMTYPFTAVSSYMTGRRTSR